MMLLLLFVSSSPLPSSQIPVLLVCFRCLLGLVLQQTEGLRAVGFALRPGSGLLARGARMQLLSGPAANDSTLTGTHPLEGSGCFAGDAGISTPPENPLPSSSPLSSIIIITSKI